MTCKKECMEQKKDGTLKDCPIVKENEELKAKIENLKKTYRKQRNKRIDELQKRNAELKKEISVLLSCSNCPENKGGYICEKEYNDKCLSQKIEYIKELKEQIEKMKCCENCKHCEFKIVSDGSTRAICKQLKGDVCLSNNYEYWELAE